ncbi:hypothetical protein [Sinorhizobium fredii]|uniref:hypothetical protein n=1 Tax=Rhizobium fredii TaxID=380 RepID=UPI00339A27AC
MTDIILILHDAVETHLPQIIDGDNRQAALCYLRGLKTVLASRPSTCPSADVIPIEDQLLRSRVQRAVRCRRRSALADARVYIEHSLDEFGEAVHENE